MSSKQSVSNNCNRPLSGDASGNTFTGAWESSAGALVIAVFVASPTLGYVTIEQSNDRGVTIQLTDTFNVGASQLDAMQVYRVPSGFAFFRVIFHNSEGNQTYLSLNTYLEDFYSSPNVTATISGVVDVNATNLITETLATRRVDYLVVGNWYRVATVGITTGAQWNAIGAIVNGESVPAIGRLFKCLSVGPAVAGGGTCYDVEYTTDMSANVSGTVSLTNPTTVRVADYYGDPILTTSGNLMVGINNIYTANPLHTIVDSGTVGLSTSANTIKIDQANNGVKVNPTAQAPVRVTGLGDTANSIGGPGLLYGISYQNKSSTVDCWVKLYDKATAPTASDTPFLIQYLESVQQYNLTHSNDDCYNAPIANTLWVRASLLPADNDSTDTGIEAEITAFVGS